MSTFLRRLAGILSVSLTLFAGKALACSVCGCDPAALTLGLDRPSTNSVRLAVEDRYLTKESGLDSEFEGERENRMLVRAQFAVAKKFVAQLEVPFFLWRDHVGPTGSVDDTGRGLGDVQVTGRYELLRTGGFVPRHVLSLVGALRFRPAPTTAASTATSTSTSSSAPARGIRRSASGTRSAITPGPGTPGARCA